MRTMQCVIGELWFLWYLITIDICVQTPSKTTRNIPPSSIPCKKNDTSVGKLKELWWIVRKRANNRASGLISEKTHLPN